MKLTEKIDLFWYWNPLKWGMSKYEAPTYYGYHVGPFVIVVFKRLVW